MSGIDCLADTNAILYYLSGNDCMKPFQACKFGVSIISEMELLSYSGIGGEEERQIRGFLRENVSVPITEEIKNKTIEIRRRYRVKLPDAVIAASAIVMDLNLLTADTGFRKIEEVRLELLQPKPRSL